MIKTDQKRLSASDIELKLDQDHYPQQLKDNQSSKSQVIAIQQQILRVNGTQDHRHVQHFLPATPTKPKIYDFQSDEAHTQQSNNLNPQLNLTIQEKNITIKESQPIEYEIPQKIPERAQLKQCVFCAELIPDQKFIKVFRCDHIYCEQCLKIYIQTQIKNNKIVICPQSNCNSIIDEQSSYFKNLQLVWHEKYDIVKFKKSIQLDNGLVLCPDQNCKKGYIKIQPNAKNGECKQCKVSYCLKCKVKSHRGKCQSFQQILLKDKFKYKRCFGCKRVVQRNQGCPHMTCKCGTQFCYYCGGAWGSPHRCIRHLAGGQLITDKLYQRFKCMRPEDFEYEYTILGFLLKLPYYFLCSLILSLYTIWSLFILVLMTIGIFVGMLFSGYLAMLCKLYKDGNTAGKILFVVSIFLLPIAFVAGWMISFCYMMYQTFPKYLQLALSARLLPCFLC